MKKLFTILMLSFSLYGISLAQTEVRPNILFIITDDQSFPHASAYGYQGVETPAFDKIAEQGLLFTNAYTQAPGCSPSRASILTGLHIWQLEEAGSHAAGFPTKYKGFQELLAAKGYHTGYTGKGWSPGDYKALGRTQNPAGKEYNQQKIVSPDGMSFIDYYKNFRNFLDEDSSEAAFSFWMGGQEPHRVYKQGLGIARGKDTAKIEVPAFLPNDPVVKADMADYLLEIEWFDQQVGRVLDMLEDRNLLENTIIVYTSDNGMPFPRAKGNIYEHGTHVPLAIMWPAEIKEVKVVKDPVGLIDLMPWFMQSSGFELQALNQQLGYKISGESILNKISSEKPTIVYSGRERHSSARWKNLPYSSRSIRKGDYLLIYNFFPERWPSGAPEQLNLDKKECCQGYDDIDNSPSLELLMDGDRKNLNAGAIDLEKSGKKSVEKYVEYVSLFGALRPQVELYNVKNDPVCLVNLALKSDYKKQKNSLKLELLNYLESTYDPRMNDDDSFDKYPRRVGSIKEYPKPDWAN